MAVVAGCGISELARVVGTGFTDRKVEALPGSGRRDLRQLGEVGSIRRPPVKARMRSACVVEVEIPADRSTGLGDGAVSSEVDLLVLDRSPEPLDEDVVAPSTLAVHADPDPIAGQYPGEDFAGELGGFMRSSQHRDRGWCDGGSATFVSGLAGQVAVAGATACCAAGASASVLGVHRGGHDERGRGDGGWGIAAGRDPLVP